MAVVLQAQGIMISVISSAVTRYMPLADCWIDFNQNVTEANSQVIYRSDGTISNVWCYIETNTRNGSSTIKVRKNGFDGNEVLTIPSSTTGQFEDILNSDAIVSFDRLALQLVVGGTLGNLQPRMFREFFASATNTVKRHAVASSAGSSATNTFYYSFGGRRDADNTSEARANTYIPTSGTAKNLFVNVATNTRNGSSVFRSRKNGANGSLFITVPSSTTGLFEDLVNSDSFAAADFGCFQYNNGGTSGTLLFNVLATDYETTDESFFHAWARPGGGNVAGENITGYSAISGEHNSAQGSDRRTYIEIGLDRLVKKMSVYVDSNIFDIADPAMTFRSRVNEAFGNLLISIPFLATGRFTDIDHQDLVNPSSLLNYRIDTFTGDGGGLVNWRNISCLISPISVSIIGIYRHFESQRYFDASSARNLVFNSDRQNIVVSSSDKDFLENAD